jgi:hypothetical protein
MIPKQCNTHHYTQITPQHQTATYLTKHEIGVILHDYLAMCVRLTYRCIYLRHLSDHIQPNPGPLAAYKRRTREYKKNPQLSPCEFTS